MRAIVIVLAALLLAGCARPGSGPAPSVATTEAGNGTPSFALPDDRGVSAAANETNATEKGAGGVEHKHDYWQGHDQVVLFSGSVPISTIPLFPEGEGSTPKGVGYLKLGKLDGSEAPALVFEGAEKVTLLAKTPTVRGQPSPVPNALTVQYRTAATSEWTQPAALPYDAPFEIKVAPRETDMPHSTQSLWNFRFVSDKPPTFSSVNLTVTVTKGSEVVDWPGHPDFYPDRTERVVFDADVTTHQFGFPQNAFYEGMEAWKAPDKLVSYGTGKVDVFVNVSSFSSSPPGLTPASYVLYAHNATEMGVTCCDGLSYDDADGKNDLKSYHFTIDVDPAGMDGPYQPASRWGFHLAAAIGADLPAVGATGFTDGASYDVVYHMTIIAHKAETAAPLSA